MLQEMVRSSTIGFPRIGPRRELKKALEGYWSGRVSAADLAAEARALRQANWEFQRRAGIDHIPSGDFSLYDHVLDAAVMIGAIPGRYWEPDGTVSLDSYFAMARGGQLGGRPVGALEMTKWFDTNYHYLVPEIGPASVSLASTKFVDEAPRGLGARHPDPSRAHRARDVPAAVQGDPDRPGRPISPSCRLDRRLRAKSWWPWRRPGPPGCRSTSRCSAWTADIDASMLTAPAYDRLADAAPGVQAVCVATYFAGLRRQLAHRPWPSRSTRSAPGSRADPDQLEAALSGAPER